MSKGMKYFFLLIIALFFFTTANAQVETAKEFNALYIPEDVVKQLSYENFKKIKLLHTAIMNYGSGKEEFDRIVDTYAEASALYFQNKVIESANLFTKNKKDIDDVALKIAKTYKTDTEKLHTNIIKMYVKYKVSMSLKGDQVSSGPETAISSASAGVQLANDYLERSKYVDAINYFRRAKDSCFMVYKILEVPLPEEFKKDVVDNKNQIYVSKEKKI